MAKSLKRHEALQPLSREHMNGLIQARNLQRVSSGTITRRLEGIKAFVDAWQDEIAHHFDDEERLLLPLIDEGHAHRLLKEHQLLRNFAARCAARSHSVAAEPEDLRDMGQLLHDHIRWEERVLFELVQQEHPDSLNAMTQEAAQIEQRRPQSRARTRLDDWPPQESR